MATEVELAAAGWPHIVVSKKNWGDAVTAVHSKEIKAVTPVLKCLRIMNLCPLSIVSQLSQIALRVYGGTNQGKQIQTPDQYLNQVAWYVNAVDIITDEIGIYQKLKEAQSGL